jgi:hypothetical protein
VRRFEDRVIVITGDAGYVNGATYTVDGGLTA